MNKSLKYVDDLSNLIDQLADSGLDPNILDSAVDLPRAKNVIEFALSPTFLNSKLFAKQAEQAVKLFAEWCPHCTDKDYIENVPVADTMGQFQDHVILLDKGICPHCHKNKKELFDTIPVELVSCLGQRSGKSALAGGILSTYILHRFLMIPNPSRYYDQQSNSMYEITFVAIDLTQIEGTLWSYFTGAIATSPWFKEYNKALHEKEKKISASKNSLCKIMDTYIWYGNKRVLASFRAADGRGLRGATRIVGAVDELGLFNATTKEKKNKAIRANANETYTSLDNSLRTIRAVSDLLWNKGDYDTLPSYMINIGSPSSQFDKMMTLLKESENDSRKVAFHWSSWEASPIITRESLKSKEINSPFEFWRDFGALPPLADSPLIGNEKSVYGCKAALQPIFRTKHKYIEDKAGSGKFISAELLYCLEDKRTARLITCDAGEKNNHFCITAHHLESSNDEISLYMDGLIEVAPEYIKEKDDFITVHFPSLSKLIIELCIKLNVIYVVWDRWQSSGEVQRLRDLSIKAERYSPKLQDFKDYANLVYAGNYKMPMWEHKSLTDLDVTNKEAVKRAPYTHAAIQIATVREIGKKIVKPEYGEDDIFRSIVLASRYVQMPDIQKEMIRTGLGNFAAKRSGVSCLGSVRGKTTGMGGNIGMSSSSSGIGSVRMRSQRY